MTKRIFFHIGHERTGTTSFQRFCTANEEMLLRYGVHYPRKNTGFSGQGHFCLAACYLDPTLAEFVLHPERLGREEVVASLKQEIESSDNEIFLISAEHFSSRFGLTQIVQLAKDFSTYDCTIVLVLRRHLEMAVSSYSAYILSGGRLSPDEFVEALWTPDANWPKATQEVFERYLRYSAIVQNWASCFGRENMILISALEQNDVIPSLLVRLFDIKLGHRDIGVYRDNGSRDYRELEAIRALNKVIPTWEEIAAKGAIESWPDILEKRELLIGRIPRVSSVAREPRLSESSLSTIRRFAEQDESRLGERLFDGTPLTGQYPSASSLGEPMNAPEESLLSRVLVDMTQQHMTLLADLNAFQAKLGELEELGSARARAAELEKTLEAQSHDLRHLSDNLETAQNELIISRTKMAALEATLVSKSADISRLNTELIDSQRRIMELTDALEAHTNELDLIRASLSWQLTRPLRWISQKYPWIACRKI